MYTIGQWLQGKVDFNLTEANIYAACEEFDVSPNTPFAICDDRVRDLSLANIYELLSVSSSVSSGEYDSDGGWQHRASAKNVVDKQWFAKEAERLRAKWGVTSNVNINKITFKNLY